MSEIRFEMRILTYMENINFLEKSDKGKGDVLRREVRRGYEWLSTRR